MKDLINQEMFEMLWSQDPNPGPECYEGCRDSDNSWIVYFTAAWCGPCKRLNTAVLDMAAQKRNLTIWKCDVVVNDETSGFCKVQSFPTFMHFQPNKLVSTIQSNDTDTVVRWIMEQ